MKNLVKINFNPKIIIFKIIAIFAAELLSILTRNFSILTTKLVALIFKTTIKFRHGIFIIDHQIPDYLKFF
jgi:hypothetical protein